MTNNTRASANQAIGGLRMKRAPPAMRAMKALGARRAVERYHRMSRNVCSCRGGEQEARKGLRRLSEHRVEGFANRADANQLALAVRCRGGRIADVRLRHDAPAEAHLRCLAHAK